jgi:transcriptional regulator with XRE-family HTH domain
MITGKQLRAARMLAEWDATDLARKTGLTSETIFKIERGTTNPRPATVAKIIQAFEKERIEFLDNSGVRLKDDTLRVIDEGDPYLQVLDDVYYTLQKGDEVLFAFVRNQLSPPSVIESDLRLRRSGILFRSLIEEGDTYCLYPTKEYRWLAHQYFQNNTQVIYGNKVATMIEGNRKAVIIHNKDYMTTQKNIFNALWANSSTPPKSTAERIYE